MKVGWRLPGPGRGPVGSPPGPCPHSLSPPEGLGLGEGGGELFSKGLCGSGWDSWGGGGCRGTTPCVTHSSLLGSDSRLVPPSCPLAAGAASASFGMAAPRSQVHATLHRACDLHSFPGVPTLPCPPRPAGLRPRRKLPTVPLVLVGMGRGAQPWY